MDIETYEKFYCYSVGGPKATCFDNLDRNDLELLQKLRQNEPSNNRIEQEKIDQEYILKYLEKLQVSLPLNTGKRTNIIDDLLYTPHSF